MIRAGAFVVEQTRGGADVGGVVDKQGGVGLGGLQRGQGFGVCAVLQFVEFDGLDEGSELGLRESDAQFVVHAAALLEAEIKECAVHAYGAEHARCADEGGDFAAAFSAADQAPDDGGQAEGQAEQGDEGDARQHIGGGMDARGAGVGRGGLFGRLLHGVLLRVEKAVPAYAGMTFLKTGFAHFQTALL